MYSCYLLFYFWQAVIDLHLPCVKQCSLVFCNVVIMFISWSMVCKDLMFICLCLHGQWFVKIWCLIAYVWFSFCFVLVTALVWKDTLFKSWFKSFLLHDCHIWCFLTCFREYRHACALRVLMCRALFPGGSKIFVRWSFFQFSIYRLQYSFRDNCDMQNHRWRWSIFLGILALWYEVFSCP